MSVDRSSWCALAVSLIAHLTLAVTTVALVASDVAPVAAAEQPGLGQSDGAWAGDTFDIDGLVAGEPGRGRAMDGDNPDPPAERPESERDGQPPEPSGDPSRAEQGPPAAAALPEPGPELEESAKPEPVDPAGEPTVRPEPAVPPSQGSATDEPGADSAPRGEADRQAASSKAQPGASPSTEAGSGQGKAGDGRARRYGAAGHGRGVRVLAPAFARAIPAAVSGDRAWSRLPLGPAGRLEITVTLDGDGTIVEVPVPDETPSHLRAIVERTMALLRAGRFALTGATGAGTETLRIEVTLSQQDPIDHDSAKPTDALRLGHQPPSADEPGRAHFTLVSGRHFEALITVLSSTARLSDPIAGESASGSGRSGRPDSG